MKPELRRRIFISAVLFIAVAATVYGFLPGAEEVDLVKASRGVLQVAIEEEGRTRLKDRFVVSAPAAGFMQRSDFKVGDAVRKGQSLAVLEPLRSQSLDPRSYAEAKETVSAAQALLKAAQQKERAAQADADYVKKRHERLKALFVKGSIAKDTLEQAEAEANRSQASFLAAAASSAAAKADLERAQNAMKNYGAGGKAGGKGNMAVTSPVSGRIFKIHRESASAVAAGEPLVDVGNQADLEVRVEVLSSDAVRIKQGTPVIFKRWGNDNPLSGAVKIVEPAGFTKISSLGVEEQRVLVIAEITSPPDVWRALGDGYRLDAHFIIWEEKNVLQVPASALFRQGSEWAVFVEASGKARLRTVKIGQRNGLAAQIVAGLAEGEKVVAHPGDAVKDGGRIKPRE
jgi:HlyD family secretion protein